jgi:glycosyltransferase involved in cell wall biosynthesis
MAASVRSTLRRLQRDWDFDLIDAHYFYPDGVAAAILARELNKPLVITARGTDLTLIPDFPCPRRQIVRAAGFADALVTVCEALKQPLIALGMPDSKITVLRNGVDLTQFQPPASDAERCALRAQWDMKGPTLLSVGHLIERKGHHLVIDALADLPGVALLIAGDGPEHTALTERAIARGVADRVRLLGQIANDRLASLYGAADLLVLASSREGWANVLLEAMACGTFVAATDVWGTGEVVTRREAGQLIPTRDSAAIASYVRQMLADPPDRAATRRYAEAFSWDQTTQGQIDLFTRVMATRDGRS